MNILSRASTLTAMIALAGGLGDAAWAAQDGVMEIEQITVTARKRDEAITDVPLFITAQSGEALERANISNTVDFIGKLPSISKSSDFLSPGKDFDLIVIRGVGANGGQEPAAPVFVDGVYMPRLGFDTDFADVERVEVLYGPQSTLFGRNTEAGAINIVTRRPGDEFRARLQFMVDRFNTFEAKGSVSGPIAENLYAGLALEGMQTDGYLKNVGAHNVYSAQGDGADEPGARLNSDIRNLDDPDTGRDIRTRGSLRWVPSSDFEAYLTVDAQKFEGGFGLPGVPRGCRCYELDTDLTLLAKDENYGAALHLDYDTGLGFEVASITGYRYLRTTQPFDFDGGSGAGPTGDPFPFDQLDEFGNPMHEPEIPGVTNTQRGNFQDYRIRQEIFSEELRLTSNTSGPFQWLAGFYYFNEGFTSERRLSMLGANGFPWFNERQDVDIDRDGWAVFGQVNYDITDSLQASGGLRYSKESSSADTIMRWFTPTFLGTYGGIDNPNGGAHTKSLSQDNISFSASVRWNVTEDISTYVTVANAFKAGGYQLAPSGTDADEPYRAETAMSYEWGVKANTLDNRLQFNLAAFYIELKDQQVRSIALINGLAFTREQNAAESSSRGFNFDAVFLPTDDLRLTTAVGYTKARFDEFILAGGLDFSGEPARYVPKWTANVGVDWVVPVETNWFESITLFGNWQYVDNIIGGFDGVDVDVQLNVDSWNIFNAGARFEINDRVNATLFVENIADSYIETRAWNVFFFSNPGGANRVMSNVLPPRNVGLRLGVDF